MTMTVTMNLTNINMNISQQLMKIDGHHTVYKKQAEQTVPPLGSLRRMEGVLSWRKVKLVDLNDKDPVQRRSSYRPAINELHLGVTTFNRTDTGPWYMVGHWSESGRWTNRKNNQSWQAGDAFVLYLICPV